MHGAVRDADGEGPAGRWALYSPSHPLFETLGIQAPSPLRLCSSTMPRVVPVAVVLSTSSSSSPTGRTACFLPPASSQSPSERQTTGDKRGPLLPVEKPQFNERPCCSGFKFL